MTRRPRLATPAPATLPRPVLPRPNHAVLDLLARRNQLEVELAALQRLGPPVGGLPRTVSEQRTLRKWTALRAQLEAVELELLRAEGEAQRNGN